MPPYEVSAHITRVDVLTTARKSSSRANQSASACRRCEKREAERARQATCRAQHGERAGVVVAEEGRRDHRQHLRIAHPDRRWLACPSACIVSSITT